MHAIVTSVHNSRSIKHTSGGGGHSTLGYAPCATKKTLLFFARFHRKTPIFTNCHPMTPYFSKISTFLTKCWEIFGHFGPESPYFLCILLKDPLFLCTLSLKDPLFWHNLSPKDPYIWGTWWHSYVTFICECPPRDTSIHYLWLNLTHNKIWRWKKKCIYRVGQTETSPSGVVCKDSTSPKIEAHPGRWRMSQGLAWQFA